MQKQYNLHVKKYGKKHEDRVIDKTLEEMAELQVELMKRRNKGKSTRLEIVKEIVDVKICLEFLLRDLSCSEIEEGTHAKAKITKMEKQLESL